MNDDQLLLPILKRARETERDALTVMALDREIDRREQRVRLMYPVTASVDKYMEAQRLKICQQTHLKGF